MELHHFFAPDMRRAIELVKSSLGVDAIILSQKSVEGGVEIQAAIEHQEDELEKNELLDKSFPKKQSHENKPIYHETTQNLEISSVKAEISMLRNMLELQMKMFSDKKRAHLSKNQISIRNVFSTAGFSTDICNIIIEKIEADSSFQSCVIESTQLISSLMSGGQYPFFKEGGIFALVGPTGVGKTTCIAKIAAKYVMEHSKKDIGIITTDFYRVGGFEQLNLYAKILNIPLICARNTTEFSNAIEELKNKKLILIDTAGVSPEFSEILQKLSIIKNEKDKIKCFLTLSANSQINSLKKCFMDFSNIGIDECIITKVDESNSIGGLLSLLIENKIPVSYLSQGQKIPDDFEEVTPAILVKMSLSLLNASSTLEDQEQEGNALRVCEEVL